MTDSIRFDAYHLWLGIPPDEQPPNHYRLLGLSQSEQNSAVISNAADQRMAHVRAAQTGEHGDEAQRLLNEISRARVVLLDTGSKQTYDASLREDATAARPKPRPKSRRVSSGERALPSPAALPIAQPLSVPVAAAPARRPPRHETSTAFVPSHRTTTTPKPNKFNALVIGVVGAAVAGTLLLLSGVGVAWMLWSNSPPVAEADLRSEDSSFAAPPPQLSSPYPNSPTVVSDIPDVATNQPVPAVEDDAGTLRDSDDEGEPTMPSVEPAPPVQSPEHPVVDEQPLLPTRGEVPSQAEQRPVLAQLEELYSPADLKTDEQKIEVAREMLRLGSDKNATAVERFVLLRRAMELSSQTAQVVLMSQTISRMAEDFVVDSTKAEGVMLVRMARDGSYRRHVREYLDHVAEFADDAMELDRHDVATSVLAAVLEFPDSVVTASTRDGFQRSHQRAKTQQQLYLAVVEAERAVAIDNGDAAAHLVLARWYCFQKGDWQQGVTHLARSSHPQLQAVAAAELATDARTDAGRLNAGNLWWDAAQVADASLQTALYRRSAYWYRQVNAASVGGLDRVTLQKRIGELNDRFSTTLANDDDDESGDRLVSLLAKGIKAVRERRYGDADRYFGHCIRVDADNGAAINNYALTGLRIGQSQRAIRQWQRLIDSKIATPEVLQNLRRAQQLVQSGEVVLDRVSAGELDAMIATAQQASDFGSYSSRQGFLYCVLSDVGRQAPLEDRNCMLCNGDGQVDCPVRGCSRGKVRVMRQTVVARNTITGQPIINSTPVSVPCDNCDAEGFISCQRCYNGTDRRLGY